MINAAVLIEYLENPLYKRVFDKFIIDDEYNIVSDSIYSIDISYIKNVKINDAIMIDNIISSSDTESLLKNFKYNNHSDWRLPSLFELRNILLPFEIKNICLPVLADKVTFLSNEFYCGDHDNLSVISYRRYIKKNGDVYYKMNWDYVYPGSFLNLILVR